VVEEDIDQIYLEQRILDGLHKHLCSRNFKTNFDENEKKAVNYNLEDDNCSDISKYAIEP
jgi:hypothetical protein